MSGDANPGMKRSLLIALRMTVLSLLALGLAYPLLMTGIARLAFPQASSGSLVKRGNDVVGSALIGQGFQSDRYFHSRPSAAGNGYDAMASSASNLAPTSQKLVEDVKRRVDAVVSTEVDAIGGDVPVDLVTASGSGLDPDISPDSALLQAERIARVRGLDPEAVRELVRRHTKERQFGFLGERRVNVLELNLALDALSSR